MKAKAFIESVFNQFGVNSLSHIPTTFVVELASREEDGSRGDCPCRKAVEA